MTVMIKYIERKPPSRNINVVLPTCSPHVKQVFNAMVPAELLPGGVNAMVVELLMNYEESQYFVSAFFTMLEFNIEHMAEDRAWYYDALIRSNTWSLMVTVFLEEFFLHYTAMLLDLFGKDSFSVVKILGYPGPANIFVELQRD